ncbi:ornithine carbamoyltransferase [Caminibacter pacificus]|uniref:Ornithine carbamoyltransferase n=1 Tax=Caminibacter pacificus TaxID=1424653 RepID=A0AAJ4RBX2_9BACT|nr:ornithine carbamoyltransferase [Caminibacter pacificus]NPA88406.1 ornithine carbamoyltransferase [Campylobacterota bacterium]QCI28784.1 ornithine carbamoyltransferase [Caminibacter pacificus]ROR39372.1 ornithine carbamoyltransferase [Caminibacter pacificus]
MRHFLWLIDYTKEEIKEIIDLGFEIKKETKLGIFKPYMKYKQLAMIFEKSSTRTRVSFEVGINQLGGNGIFLSSRDIQLGRGEPLKDTARVISRMVDMVMIRTFGQDRLEEFAKYSKVPVINGLTDLCHPVQLLADLMTMIEFGKFDFENPSNTTVAYVGDGNNMANSWAILASKLGFNLRIATPKGYEIDENIKQKALEFAKKSGAKLEFLYDPKAAVKDADVVTTDTWVSMGQEEEKEKRIKDFRGFEVDSELMKLAKSDAIFLHCLPAYRGYEVSEEVFESHADEIFQEAENRLHAQKGLMVWLNK